MLQGCHCWVEEFRLASNASIGAAFGDVSYREKIVDIDSDLRFMQIGRGSRGSAALIALMARWSHGVLARFRKKVVADVKVQTITNVSSKR